MPLTFTRDLPFVVDKYDEQTFPFVRAVREALRVDDLSLLHKQFDPRRVLKPIEDQSTPLHRTFYTAFCSDAYGLCLLYRRFVAQVAPLVVSGGYVYQAVPTFRIQFPNNLAVGEFHKDGDYGHPEGERVFWVPLTNAKMTTAVQFKNETTGELTAAEVSPPEFWTGNTRDYLHGNLLNDTGLTRVSFDFRVLPIEKYNPDNQACSIAAKKRFVVGDYWEAADDLGKEDR